jgi:hypothetical protein
MPHQGSVYAIRHLMCQDSNRGAVIGAAVTDRNQCHFGTMSGHQMRIDTLLSCQSVGPLTSVEWITTTAPPPSSMHLLCAKSRLLPSSSTSHLIQYQLAWPVSQNRALVSRSVGSVLKWRDRSQRHTAAVNWVENMVDEHPIKLE